MDCVISLLLFLFVVNFSTLLVDDSQLTKKKYKEENNRIEITTTNLPV